MSGAAYIRAAAKVDQPPKSNAWATRKFHPAAQAKAYDRWECLCTKRSGWDTADGLRSTGQPGAAVPT